ncbi:MFS transporter [Nocardioidaceae bacterium]|nr:MFS transporter [Nocardioidaceae bacterium]
MWTVAVAAYFLAVFHRSSLAVAGLVAADRFGISASQLATFVTLQLVVYAGLQVPVGLLVDRFGPRRVLVAGAVLMTVSQAAFAFADSYAAALVARAFVGVGDALTFICVLRLVATWFDGRRVPVVTQLTAVIGQGGALVAAVPMTYALAQLGWTPAYLTAALAGVLVTVLLLLVVRDAPGARSVSGQALSLAQVRGSLAASWAHPGTRLGFWMHFVTQFSATTLGLLWGYPFFVRGEGRTPAEAGLLLSIMVVAVIAAGPLLGMRTAARPWQRSNLVLGIVAAIVVTWTVVLLWPGPAPFWLLVVLVVVAGIGGPASVIGFDLARTSNPAERVASATGVVNQGGFTASLVLVVVIGLLLDWQTPGTSDAYTPEAFKVAMSFQYVLWTLGLVQVWRWRQKARAYLRDEDPDWVAAQLALARPWRPARRRTRDEPS